MIFSIVVLVICVGFVWSENERDVGYFWAKTYRRGTGVLADSYPEKEYLKDRPSTAISFSGGGSRSFVSAMGQLAALTQLGLIENIQYVTGISGGSWATITYGYSQIEDDSVLLGPITDPSAITREGLSEMNEQCARGFTTPLVMLRTFQDIFTKEASDVGDAYADVLSATYFEPVGINRDTLFSWNEATVSDIKSRNPSLANETFITPKKGRPYPLVAATYVGPSEFAPYRTPNANWTYFEMSPLYMGQMFERNVTYHHERLLKRRRHYTQTTFGGAVESFAIGREGSQAPATGAVPGDGVLSIPVPKKRWDLAHAGGASGYAPGSFIEGSFAEKVINLSLFQDYWSPAEAAPEVTRSMWTDGGATDNLLLGGLLQRGIKNIVLFVNCQQPLRPASDWDVATEPFTKDDITYEMGFYFGMQPSDYNHFTERVTGYDMTQYFAQEDWVPYIQNLQKAQQDGRGILSTMKLTTVKNDHFGIPAGQNVTLTTYYLGRAAKWEAQLSPEMHDLLVPSGDAAADPSNTVPKGPFKHFPHYATQGGGIKHEKANALADLTGWSVLQYAEELREIFSA